MQSNRRKRLLFSWELLREILADGKHEGGYSIIADAVPADARVINVRLGWPDYVELLIESESFPEVNLGDEIPQLTPVFKKEFAPCLTAK